MKKFLVLGIGNAQVDLLRFLRNSGKFEVHALSNTEFGRGLQYADKFECINITDKDAVLDYASRNNIDIIYSIGSDVAMPTATFVSEKLGKPCFVSYETAKVCNNKNEFREKLKNCYGAVPFQVLKNAEDINLSSNLRFPLIVKPVDSQGQRGVGTAHNINEVKTLFYTALTYSRSKKVIIEEKIQGEEISVNVYLHNGELVFFLPSGRVSWEEFDGGIIHKHYIPSNLSAEAVTNVERLVKETLSSLSITDGPAYFQIKMSNDTPYLIEVTPRFDGCHMWQLILHSCNVNLLETAIRHLTTSSFNPISIDKVHPYCLEFYCQPPGESFVLPSKEEFLSYEELYYREGDVVREMNGKMEKCGYKIFEL
ncbi:ATP-grasp domain-containing protein [Vibrio parahaemolyticus]|uniref:L-arginine-specific L-amino acid ligase n=1 Tax=Vibrio parahaemolyticus TaxID=670 RepID=A0A7M1WCL7_VIBPH|nr:ATP-grasp domain-containing protein [Vibrio parahaemolyticus]ELA7156564.1 ATP-grasp domain-containing protein [Vibrio parahaemolyticus]ELB2086915.1 ATP-grasp domain-containing protein [Vibrio parahaemolyticus]ELB2920170.1 ATP-grasp domain-containing protein [Vibrio parahaemolyticus]MCR9852002.1 ATP-grasp domain-containing protein [Vibrio parahaemolyticus]MDF4398123.1 ATP-grasp domain-containing protein [Vibrio parahaemolyticus]